MGKAFRKICIVGPGAIGGMMAVMLERAGFDVCALARAPKAGAINARGLTLLYGGETLTASLKASDDPMSLGPQDLVIVTLKSNVLAEVAPRIPPLCRPDTPIVMAMNGLPWWFFDGFGGALAGSRLKSLDPDGVLARLIPLEQVIWGVVNCSVSELSDGTLEHTNNNHLALGRPNDDHAGLDGVAEVFQTAGYTCALSDNIRQDIWAKLIVNATVNPVSALAMARIDEIYDEPLVRECVVLAAAEAHAVGKSLGLDAGPVQVERLKGVRVRTSMLQDLERGRPLELGSIVDVVVEIAELTGMPAPRLRALLGLMRLRAKTAGSA
ncbi:MAG: 2-dehydropantoate 2-reductase [Rhodospirillaceae bacterium]